MSEYYTIRPLRWRKVFQDWRQAYEAGNYAVVRVRQDCDPALPWDTWRWEYSFCEYYDESSTECASATEGKNAAQQDWLNRLLPSLKPVKE